jgi:hypothetical protein
MASSIKKKKVRTLEVWCTLPLGKFGWYDLKRIKSGTRFMIDPKDFSKRWMSKVPPSPEDAESPEVKGNNQGSGKVPPSPEDAESPEVKGNNQGSSDDAGEVNGIKQSIKPSGGGKAVGSQG